jgi:hypothetical protein
MLRMLVQLPKDASGWDLEGQQWAELKQELLRSKWLDDASLDCEPLTHAGGRFGCPCFTGVCVFVPCCSGHQVPAHRRGAG